MGEDVVVKKDEHGRWFPCYEKREFTNQNIDMSNAGTF